MWEAVAPDGRTCAVSIVALDDEARATARLRRLEALTRVSHPHVVDVLDVVPLDGRCAVVSERLEGPSLATVRVSRSPLDLGEGAWLLSAAAQGLAHLHSHGVVHGDVSPANILLSAGRGPVVLDLAGDLAAEFGTEGFRAPEREAGAAAGAPGDVWSLATTVLWMLSRDGRARAAAVLAPALEDRPSARCDAVALESLAGLLAPERPIALPSPAALAQASLRAGAALEPTRLADARRSGAGRRRPRGAGAGTPAGAAGGHRRIPVPLARDVGAVLAGVAVAIGVGFSVWPPADGEVDGRAGAVAEAAAPGARIAGASTPDEIATASIDTASIDTASIDAQAIDAVVRRLLTERDRALVAADPEALGRLTVPGSPAAEADASLLGSLTATGVRLSGLATLVEEVRPVDVEARIARVAVVTRQTAHERRTSGPEAPVVIPAQPARCTLLVLAREGEEWRAQDTAICPADEG